MCLRDVSASFARAFAWSSAVSWFARKSCSWRHSYRQKSEEVKDDKTGSSRVPLFVCVAALRVGRIVILHYVARFCELRELVPVAERWKQTLFVASARACLAALNRSVTLSSWSCVFARVISGG